MNECIICLDPCADTMKCCNAHIHTTCMCDILEKGFKVCPHCQRPLYNAQIPDPQTIQTFYVPPITYPHRRNMCRSFFESVGVFIVLLGGLELMSIYVQP